MPVIAGGYNQHFRGSQALNFDERALSFLCNQSWLYGVLSLPERAISRGVLIVVGGPQYRAGSHRQFTLLARDLAADGVPVMRFDYRGMGDSEGTACTFEDAHDDIRLAIDQFYAELPSLKEIVIWGLCDAASAALFYAYRDSRVRGLVLVNPWVRTEEGIAKAYFRHYYLGRLADRELWGRILRGGFDYRRAALSMFGLAKQALRFRLKNKPAALPTAEGKCSDLRTLPDRMLDGFDRFGGHVLLILSGNDLTAQEFSDLVKRSRKWRKLVGSRRVQRHDLPQANHTFAHRDWRKQVSAWTKEWIASW